MKTIQDGKEILDTNLISYGYHTFGELYKHRTHLFLALCRQIYNSNLEYPTGITLFKSKKHNDGLEFEGWFIIQLETDEGQISYYIPNEYWDECEFIETLDKANEWDGHTSYDVLERLLNL